MDDHSASGIAGKMMAAAVRAIDGSVRVLLGLRNRLESPADDDDPSRDSREDSRPADAAAPPRPPSLLHRASVVLICLLLGGAAGGLIAYRALSKLHHEREQILERMQGEIEQAKKEMARSLSAEVKYRMQLRDARQELAGYKREGGDLNDPLLATKRGGPPVARDAGAGAAASPKQAAPNKTGTCVAGTGNVAENLGDCIKKFNSQ